MIGNAGEHWPKLSAFKRLLFVDDERGIRETLPVILRRYGFAVNVAATVQEALEEIRKQQFDALLCDLNIDGEKDGYEVVRAIRAIDPACVAVILTAYPDVESAIEGIHHGVDDYIIKPSSADMLAALLTEKLAERREKATQRVPPHAI
jgi:DNA-binding NtrC family response regulator